MYFRMFLFTLLIFLQLLLVFSGGFLIRSKGNSLFLQFNCLGSPARHKLHFCIGVTDVSSLPSADLIGFLRDPQAKLNIPRFYTVSISDHQRKRF